jgi:endonuclease YncB( thermonuclease family)
MPFTLIKGSFHPKAGIPDGDSVRFKADNLALWARLEGAPVELGKGPLTKDTVQLRLEGIDAIEKGATKPLAIDARDNLFALLAFDANTSPEPTGYILTRMTDDRSKRPICFAFAGNPGDPDGSDIFIDRPLLRKSANYKQVRDGYAYPLYYNTLFASLRAEFNGAMKLARDAKRGNWPKDKTLKGVAVSDHADLETIAPIWPKLWRRLDTFLKDGSQLSDFVDFLAGENERLNIISIAEERGLQDIVEVTGAKVKLTVAPEDIQVIGKAGRRKR